MIERVEGEDSDGFNIWILKLSFLRVGTGENTKVHLGIELEDGAEWKRIDVIVNDTSQPTPPNIKVHNTVIGGRIKHTLEVENPSPTVDLRLESLDVSISKLDLPLEDLTIENPVVQGLPWHPVLSTTTILTPGEVRFFDLPSVNPQPSETCYLRALYTDSAGTLGNLGIVQSIGAPGCRVDAISAASLVVLTIALCGLGVVLMRRRT